MREDVKNQWVQALRSGEYKQGKIRLQKWSHSSGSYEFCCLGVLCDIARKNGALSEDDINETSENEVRFGSTVVDLPKEVREWAELDRDEAEVLTSYKDVESLGHVTLVELNDAKGWSFKEIANQIEKDWEIL